MRYRRLLSLLVVVALSGVGAVSAVAQPAPAAAPAPTGAMRIAIVNPSRVFREIQETKTMQESLRARQKDLLNKEVEQRQSIESLLKQRAELNPNHPKYREISDQIDNAKAQLQVWGATNKASLDRDSKFMIKGLYDKIEAAVAEVAQQSGVDLVIADGRRELTDIEEVPAEELQRTLATRTVLYSTKSVDLTERVITLMDANYAKDKK